MIVKLLRYLWENEDGFFGIGMGPSSQEKTQYGDVAGAANFGTSQGEGDILQAQNFWSSILSGDMSKISSVLGPQISAINKQGQQQKKTMFEFGNRGGGTNSAAQSIDDNSLSSIRSMIASLTGGAADKIGSLGTSLFNTGTSADATAFGEANVLHNQNEAKWNDIFKSSAEVAGAFLA
jgi:hypothetical protein